MSTRRADDLARIIANLSRRLEDLWRTASRIGHNHGAVTPYTPTLTATVTNPTRHLQTGATVTGHFIVENGVCTVWVFIKNAPASGTKGEGAYIVSLPVNADTSVLTASGGVGNGSQLGSGAIRDDDATANNITVGVQLRDAGSVSMPQSSGGFVTDLSPFTFAADDVPAAFMARYPIA